MSDKKPTQAEIDAFMEDLADTARRDIIPKMRASAFCIVPLTPDDVDPYMCLQVGVALLLDKPLIIIALKDAWVPARLRALADVVVTGASIQDPETKAAVHAAIAQVAEKLRGHRV